jgi:hypothetical protein
VSRRAYLALFFALLPGALAAQQARVRTVTTIRYADLRPLRLDTIAGDSTAPDTVRLVAGAREAALPLTQDVELSAWGFGVTGLRAYALVRGRAALGSGLVWPRSGDHFDALYAYLELERPAYRVRLGRQQKVSGLGFYAFDGALATVRPRTNLRAEVYGGRGLARGFLEPLSSPDIRALDPLRPDQGAVLMGANAWYAPNAASAISAVYQREILGDFSGLVSERAALDASAGFGRRLRVTGFVDADLAGGELGRVRGSVMYVLGRRGYMEAEAFRYRPVFDLTTIWGVFSPEGYEGFGGAASYGLTPGLAAFGRYLYRAYQPDSSAFLDLDDHASEVTLGARFARGDFVLSAAYRLNGGFGGAQSGGDASLAWDRPQAWRFAVRGTAFQQVEDFRVSSGTVIGGGVDARGPLFDRATVRVSLARYWHARKERPGQADLDWSQTRATVSLEWSFGASADRTTRGRP